MNTLAQPLTSVPRVGKIDTTTKAVLGFGPHAPLRARALPVGKPVTFHRKPVSITRRSAVVVRAAEEEFSLDTVKAKYDEVTMKIPPVATAAAVPVVALSLLVKSLTGSGLPGPLLGGIEGIAWLLLPLGFGSFLPRAKEIVEGGEYSMDTVMNILQKTDGVDATERAANLTDKVDPNSALGMQLQDLKAQQAKRDSLSEEEKAAKAKKNKELAQMALGLGQSISDNDSASADKRGRDDLLAQPVTATLKECMTVENYDEDITEYGDDALGTDLNLSKPELKTGAPEAREDSWRKKNLAESRVEKNEE
mmetsp:Transcript_38838/g.47030  ORF Transcript_38838/g.47030 Transcript_38838/m.47030 type:complete len:308 (-) Transcript_38838:216-1139(-)|eukprot:CAMPEP_0197848614 /NCGR_PEP_ID=MMETSP1438-20131217/9336_1 /TAXON_ID=1461541 /ORGANISM="Pterosperma sp., Strain CCMP1384" /LENGTH=307 /DNA_ID=CAMNT_0043460951 /DNA_START=71 /DNA_END=994 /DNA_ORIENTATION=+